MVILVFGVSHLSTVGNVCVRVCVYLWGGGGGGGVCVCVCVCVML